MGHNALLELIIKHLGEAHQLLLSHFRFFCFFQFF